MLGRGSFTIIFRFFSEFPSFAGTTESGTSAAAVLNRFVFRCWLLLSSYLLHIKGLLSCDNESSFRIIFAARFRNTDRPWVELFLIWTELAPTPVTIGWMLLPLQTTTGSVNLTSSAKEQFIRRHTICGRATGWEEARTLLCKHLSKLDK